MQNKMLLSLIYLFPLLVANAHASEACTSEQISINIQNTYIITGDIFYGPVKNIYATHTRPENKDGKTDDGTKIYTFSDCNKLTKFSWTSNSVISPLDSVTSVFNGELVGDNPYHLKSISDFSAPSNTSSSTTNLFYYFDNTERIVKTEDKVLTMNKVYSDADEQNKRHELSANSENIDSISVIKWSNGLIDTITGEEYGAKISFQYNYNHLGQLESIIDSETDKPQDVFLRNTLYYYDSKGFLDKTIIKYYEKDELYYTTITKCLEKDSYGNCLTTTTTDIREKFEPMTTKTTKYIYSYY